MKIKTLPLLLSISFLCLIFVPVAFADHPAEHSTKNDPTKSAPIPPPDTSSPELNRIKALEGRWKSTTSMFGKEDEEVFTEYKITAGGSAVIETSFPGTPNEMVSVYYDDDQGKLAMTHYCMMRNRPHFSLVESTKDGIKLGVTKVEGVKSENEPTMGAITMKFEDKDHFSTTCESGGSDEHKHEPMTMRFTRVN